MRQSSPWTPERVEELTRLWNAGYSAGQIVARLDFCVSRNAVIGKKYRLGLPARSTDRGHDGRSLTQRIRVRFSANGKRRVRRSTGQGGGIAANIARGVGKAFAEPPELRPDPPKPPDCEPVTLMARTSHQCCWPLGTPNGPDTLMCGAGKPAELPYCRWHQDMAKGFSRPEWTAERRERTMRAHHRSKLANDNSRYDGVPFG